MFFIARVTAKIKRRDGRLACTIYAIASRIRRVSIPKVLMPGYRAIYGLRTACISLIRWVMTTFWYAPLFCSQCAKIGSGLRYVKLQQGLPVISGGICIELGKNVTVHSRSTFAAASRFDRPTLSVGDGTYLGPGLSIGVGLEVSIGCRCLVGSNVSITDNDGHPLDPAERAMNLPLPVEAFIPVQIGDDVWIGEGATILKGVTIGDGAVVGAKSIVTSDVPPFTVVAGLPARVVKHIDRPGISPTNHCNGPAPNGNNSTVEIK